MVPLFPSPMENSHACEWDLLSLMRSLRRDVRTSQVCALRSPLRDVRSSRSRCAHISHMRSPRSHLARVRSHSHMRSHLRWDLRYLTIAHRDLGDLGDLRAHTWDLRTAAYVDEHSKSHTNNSKNCYKKKLLSSRLRLVGLRESGVVELAQPSLQFSYNGNAKSVKQC